MGLGLGLGIFGFVTRVGLGFYVGFGGFSGFVK